MPQRFRALELAVASYVFYAYATPAYAPLLLVLTVAVYFIGRAVRASAHPKRVLALGIVGVVAVLAVFKYADMAVITLNFFRHRLGIPPAPLPDIMVPLGISFVTFMLIHFLVEMYRKEAAAPTPVEFAAYVSFFPTITAGPIKRYPEFVDNARERTSRPRLDDLAFGFGRIIIGLAKKLVVADTIYAAAKPLYQAKLADPVLLFVAIYAYTLYIYFDFAGYSDIAIGTARLFGYRILENFNWPYVRRNLAEFWRNWHMSLTRFITEYVFIPLGGSRVGRVRTAFNTLLAMAVSGLWHGAAWHFVVWGLWHGVGLVVARWWRELDGALKRRSAGWAGFAHVRPVRWVSYGFGAFVTFNFVAWGWVLFALPLHEALTVYARILTFAYGTARLMIGG